MKNPSIPTITVVMLVILAACNNPSEQAKNAVNPFADTTTVADTINAETKQQLHAAKGRTAKIIGYDALVERFGRSINGLELYVFFDDTDGETIAMLTNACRTEPVLPVNKLPIHVTGIYTGPSDNITDISALIREKNLFFEVFVVEDTAWPALYNDLKTNWNGQMPAVVAMYRERELLHWFNHAPSVAELELLFQ